MIYDIEPDEWDIADEVSLADTGRPWAWRSRPQTTTEQEGDAA